MDLDESMILETLTAVAGDRTSTIVFPLPIDLLEPLVRKHGNTDQA